MNAIILEIKNRFKQGDILTRLIYVNGGVFVLFLILGILGNLFGFTAINNFLYNSFSLNTGIKNLLFKPWTIVTHQFVHAGIWHLLGNLIMLYFLGKLFLMYFNSKQLLALYFLGGFIGAGVLIVVVNLSPMFSNPISAVGASAAVMAIAIAVCAYNPNQEVFLFGALRVQLKWIGLALILIDLVSFFDGNTGGHIAHLGGAFTGYWFASAYKQGKDITKGVNKWIAKLVRLFSKKNDLTVKYRNHARELNDEEYNYYEKVTQEKVDEILDKISKSGYESLSKKEKEILFQYSKKQ